MGTIPTALLSSPTHQPYMLYSWGGTAEGLRPGQRAQLRSLPLADPFLSPLRPIGRRSAALPHPILHPPTLRFPWGQHRAGGAASLTVAQPPPTLCHLLQASRKKSHCKTESSSVWNLYGHSRNPEHSSPRQEMHPRRKGDPPSTHPNPQLCHSPNATRHFKTIPALMDCWLCPRLLIIKGRKMQMRASRELAAPSVYFTAQCQKELKQH